MNIYVIATLITVSFFISGCVSNTMVNNEQFAEGIADKCYKVQKNFNVYVNIHTWGDNPAYVVATDESRSSIPKFQEHHEVAFQLKSGEEMKITKIIDNNQGSLGHCWRVFATSKYENGKEFEIPSCWSNVQETKGEWLWVYPHAPRVVKEKGVNLKITSPYLKPLNQCN